jgi:hypothetical protein
MVSDLMVCAVAVAARKNKPAAKNVYKVLIVFFL